MVTLKKIKVKGNEYWILIHSVRKGKRVIQKKKYIGKKVPPKARLEYMKKEFLMNLNKRKYKFLTGEDVEKVEGKKEHYKNELRKLSLTEKNNRLQEFIVRFTYDSSKLSGVDVTLRQTSLILREGVIPKGFKSLKTVRELENHEKGIIAITEYKGRLDIRFIKKLHSILLSGVDDSIAGKLRSNLKRNIKIAGTSYVPPKWKDLPKELEQFFEWYKSENRKLHPLELASLIHLKTISLQPFVDGNSRLSRLLMNWILWKKGYPPVDIPIEDIEKYYDMLDKYQIEQKERPFINYIKKKFLE